MSGKVRSGRSARAGDASCGLVPPDGPGDVVVIGRGPLAAAVVTRFAAPGACADGLPSAGGGPDDAGDRPGAAGGPGRGARHGIVRAVPDLPGTAPEEALVGAAVVVLVCDDADLSLAGPGTPGAGGAGSAAEAQDRRTAMVHQAQRVLTGARLAGVRQVVAITSAMVHGAGPGRPVITDDEEPMTVPGEGQVGDLVAVESVLARAASAPGPGPAVMVLRPAAVVGPGVDTLVTRHFAAPRLLSVRGGDRTWQLVHVDDVASAVEVAVREGWSGSATVAADPVLGAADVVRISGMRRVELPASTAFATAERLHRVGALPAPADGLSYVVYPWTVDPARLRAAGWAAAHDGEACLRVLLETVRGRVSLGGRPRGGRDVAWSAAGAAVAALGTAAIWRQARLRRYG
ncbi:NAD-dependent epimerase/dehydratase family protein [Actinotalea subterranea]|uniref:NAD-dependent epimerase/dehydratase family protein n=1 Tax=Actinotalea subterranea TaxID=2607497 RepID=UPI001FE8EA00|nr:NAD-dependent epimerase/dehydratase family protein [Actinotalea subterranea]